MASDAFSQPPPDWERLADQIRGRTVMVIGGPGTGKTSLARRIARQLIEEGGLAGLLSADPGQPAVGVPTCLGLALKPPLRIGAETSVAFRSAKERHFRGAKGDNATLIDSPVLMQPAAFWFLGDTTPVRNLLPTVVGTARLAALARAQAAQPAARPAAITLVIDTSGLIDGPIGRLLKYHKTLAAEVDVVLIIERDHELETMIDVLRATPATVHRLRATSVARDRSPAERAAYRQSGYQEHFREGRVLRFDRSLLIDRQWMTGAAVDIGSSAAGTLVGLLDRRGTCLALGIIEQTGPEHVTVYTACRDAEAVVRLQLGSLSLDRHAGFAECRK